MSNGSWMRDSTDLPNGAGGTIRKKFYPKVFKTKKKGEKRF